MAKSNKSFNTKIYAVIVFFIMAGFLATITTITYKNKYNGFNPEKVAIAYAESIVNRGDGYNAYKNTIISKNYKYGDFIREYYMYPVIYRDTTYKPGDSTDELKGYNDESYISDKTSTDTGSLQGQVIDTMYDYYVQLIKETNGWDDYDTFFTKYFDKLVSVREEIFGDKYMTDEIMFTALESNVSTYGESLTGTEEEIDANTGTKTSEKTVGMYEEKFGEDCKFVYTVKSQNSVENKNDYISKMDTEKLSSYKVSADDISDVKILIIEISINDTTVIDDLEIPVVKINSTWYVDNTNVDTSELYNFYK